MRFAKSVELTLALVATRAVLFVYGADAPSGRSVSLLFENDGVWTKFGERPSALLFHEPLTSKEAAEVCKQNNETLLSRDALSEFTNQLSFFQSIGHVKPDDLFWLSSSANDDSNVIALSPSNDGPSTDANAKQHPFLCTNSAPHTVKIDTDFSTTPRTVVTSRGTTFTGTRDHLAFRFMGIPYAQPPVGDLRFQYPQKFNGTSVDATGFQPGCLQFGEFGNNDDGFNPWGNSEDCLYLNVYTPFIPSKTTDPSQLKPVLFWVFGGGNVGGIGNDPTFDGGPISTRGDIVVVNFNHRLNIFGFLALNDGVVTGNYALADKIAVLEWIKENIAAFGGDPNNVMIGGQSSGGASIIDLLKSPKAAGLFHRAAIHSGGSGSFVTQKQAQAAAEPTISQFCDGSGEDRLKCLQSLSGETLLNITQIVTSWSSAQDGVYVIEDSITQMSRGPSAVNSVPVIAGSMVEEQQSLIQERIAPNATDFNATLTTIIGASLAQTVIESGLWDPDNETSVYNATIQAATDRMVCPGNNLAHAIANASTFPAFYVYHNHRAYGLNYLNPYGLCSFPVGHPQPYYRCHSGDLYEVFGTYYIFDQPPREDNDFFFTNLLQDMWVSFARTGDPNPSIDYLKSRGPAYESTVKLLEEIGWSWPKFEQDNQVVAALNYPELELENGLPDESNGRCAAIFG